MPHPSIKTMRAFSRTIIDSRVKGHYVSKHFWTPTTGETFVCKWEPDNPTDAYAVAVMANSIVVDHVPRKISAACSRFCSETKALCTDHYWEKEMRWDL